MLMVCYPKCSTCKKAEQWLQKHKIQYDYRDIKLDNPQIEELKKWHQMSGLPLKRFFNTSGQLYRENGLATKLPAMDEEEQYKILASDGMLVKRPIVIKDQIVLVGFKETEWEEKLSVK